VRCYPFPPCLPDNVCLLRFSFVVGGTFSQLLGRLLFSQAMSLCQPGDEAVAVGLLAEAIPDRPLDGSVENPAVDEVKGSSGDPSTVAAPSLLLRKVNLREFLNGCFSSLLYTVPRSSLCHFVFAVPCSDVLEGAIRRSSGSDQSFLVRHFGRAYVGRTCGEQTSRSLSEARRAGQR